MQFIENIKNYIGRLQLERETKTKRIKRKLISFAQVNHIGIVYNANDTENERIVTAYANELRAEGKKVFMLGYVNEKHLPASKKFLLNSEFFWREKLNGINLPVKGQIGQFLQLEFDLLLNLYFEPILPLQAIAAYSNAKYRVGAHLEGGLDYSDFMVDTGTKKDLSFLIEQMNFYLRNIV
jgi:hypothetical protein